MVGFMTGWMYWYFWIIVVALEALAGADRLHYWFADVPKWEFTLGLMLLFTFINLLSVKSWGESEYWFASIKVAAISIFLLIGVLVIMGFWPGVPSGFGHLTSEGGFFPKGILPMLTGAVAATGFYFGSEIVTVAAAESAEPEKAVAQATQSVISRVLVFYLGSILVVVTILPWNDPGIVQPYVTALKSLDTPALQSLMGANGGLLAHLPGPADVMNAVILTAVLSCLNSGLFASSRMLMALSRRQDAPTTFSHIATNGVPVRAILLSTSFGFVTVFLSYLAPDTIFKFIVDSYGTVALFVYLLIAFAQLKMRKTLEATAPEKLKVKMWAFPYLTYFAIGLMFLILAAMAIIPEQRSALWFGVISAAVMLGFYFVRQGRRSEA
jgi:GABA permease